MSSVTVVSDEADLCFPQRATTKVETPNPTTELTQRAAGPNFFKDGENVQFMRAEVLKAHRFEDTTSILHLHVETHQYIHRTAQTHDSVMHQFIDVPEAPGELCFKIHFFTEHIFRVKFAGTEKVLSGLTDDPEFPPSEARMLVGHGEDVTVSFTEAAEYVQFNSPSVSIRVEKSPFRMRAYNTQSAHTPFWQQRLADIFTSDVIPTSIARHQGRTATFESFTLQPSETLCGLGERFDSASRVGRSVDFVNHDAIGTSNQRSYINVPFFWSTAGYGCFVNSIARTEWDLGVSEHGTVGFCTEEDYMDYFVISGPSPKEILQRYTQDLTGTSPVPPVWSFGLWLSRNSYQSWTVVDEVIAQADKHRIPLDDVHLDTAWFREDWNPDLIFDKERFANHEEKMTHLLSGQGIHVSLWQYTFAPPREDNILFVEGKEQGFFGMSKRPDGSRSDELFKYPEGSSGWRIDDAVIDFSNPACRSWYGKKIASLIQQGASAIKTDFGDCIPPDAHYMNILGRRFQNLYSLVYNALIYTTIKSVNPSTAIWARSGTAGSQRYPVHWGGDSQCSWSGLQGSFRATLSIGLSGFAFFSHDIGGFIGKPSVELYIRWAQVGLLCASHSRTHGAGDENAREPWAFGDEAVAVFRKFVDLRYRLLPHILQQASDGAKIGLPLIRHLILEYPTDRNVWGIETQCMLGEQVMIMPMLTPADETAHTVPVYFPSGVWFDFWTKTCVDSQGADDRRGRWIDVPTPALDSMLIFVRSGTMVCFAEAGRQRTWNRVGEVMEVELYGDSLAESGQWKCGDGQGGELSCRSIEAEQHDGQSATADRWRCVEHPDIKIAHFS